jgi:hypothetical protein
MSCVLFPFTASDAAKREVPVECGVRYGPKEGQMLDVFGGQSLPHGNCNNPGPVLFCSMVFSYLFFSYLLFLFFPLLSSSVLSLFIHSFINPVDTLI